MLACLGEDHARVVPVLLPGVDTNWVSVLGSAWKQTGETQPWKPRRSLENRAYTARWVAAADARSVLPETTRAHNDMPTEDMFPQLLCTLRHIIC